VKTINLLFFISEWWQRWSAHSSASMYDWWNASCPN